MWQWFNAEHVAIAEHASIDGVTPILLAKTKLVYAISQPEH